MAGGGVGI